MNLLAKNDGQCQSCEFDENLNILREIPFFSGLSLEALKVLAYLCTRENFKPGDYLFHQKDDDGQAFYIISGKARLFHEDATDEQMVRDYGNGSFLGGLTLMANLRRLFSMKALTDATCLILTRDKFTRVLEQFPEVRPKIVKAIAESIQSWEESFLNDCNKDCVACRRKIGVTLL